MSEISFFIPSLEGIAFPNTTAGRRDFKAFLDIYGYVRDMHAQFMDSNGTRFGEEFRLEKMLYGEKTANSIIVDAERNSTILKIFVWVKPDKTKKKGNYMFIDVSTENGRLLLKKFCSIIDNNFTIRLRMTDNKSEYVG